MLRPVVKRDAVERDEELGDETRRRLTAPEIFHQVTETPAQSVELRTRA